MGKLSSGLGSARTSLGTQEKMPMSWSPSVPNHGMGVWHWFLGLSVVMATALNSSQVYLCIWLCGEAGGRGPVLEETRRKMSSPWKRVPPCHVRGPGELETFW